MSARRVLAALLAGPLLAGCSTEAGRDALPAKTATAPQGLVVVSVTGLTPALYRAAPPEMPTLARMAAAGVSADALRPVAPASDYPTHASLLSGRKPAGHGIVADRRLGERGVTAERYDASQLEAPVLWQVARDAGLRVAALGWPSTQGDTLTWNLPDADPTRAGQTWLGAAEALGATPALLAWARGAGGDAPETLLPGPARDAVLVALACRLLERDSPPQLLLLHLGETAPLLARYGSEAPETRAAFAAVDAHLARLLACAGEGGGASRRAFVVVGDHGSVAVHDVVAPNVVLADAGLLTPSPRGDLLSWQAVSRSNGGSAFVYARSEEDARLARLALERAAQGTGAFRVVSAEEMLRVGADPQAWFGIEAKPGYFFVDAAQGETVRSTSLHAAWGYLPGAPELDAGFVAWGAGLASGVRITRMSQTDVGPTLARLLGLQLAGAEGRVLVSLLRLPSVSAQPAVREAAP